MDAARATWSVYAGAFAAADERAPRAHPAPSRARGIERLEAQ